MRKKAKRGPKTGQFPEMEEEILEWFEAPRQNGYEVSRLAVQLHAVGLAKSGKYGNTASFSDSPGWCTHLLNRHLKHLKHVWRHYT